MRRALLAAATTAPAAAAAAAPFYTRPCSRLLLQRPLPRLAAAAARPFASGGLRKTRRPAIPVKMTMEECRIAVLGPHDAAYMSELSKLPPEAKVVLKGKTLEDFEGQDAELANIDVLLLAPPAGRAMVSALWPKLTNLKWVHCLFAGVDHVIFPELVNGPVPLTNARGLFSSSLAEYGILAMSYFAKDLPRLKRQQAAANWEKYNVLELRGATLGIIGYGDIGQACARLAKAFGMQILALKRRPETAGNNGTGGERNGVDGAADEFMGPDRINELMARSDYVIVAAALTPATRGIVGKEQLACSKEGQVIINMGRGPLIVEQDLIEALQSGGRLKGAALDVFDTEPLPKEHPFWAMDNVLLSPHNMDQTATFLFESTAFFTENCARFVKGLALRNLVDKKAGY